jgi:dipeptidyl aminopeptidase/acylaminoacyl peptidase
MSAHVGEAFQLTDHPKSVSGTQWSPDSRYLYYLASDTLTTEEKERKENEDDVFAYDEDFTQRHLWRVNVDERSTERVTEGSYCILGYRLSEDGNSLVYQKGVNPLYDFFPKSEVAVLDLATGNERIVTQNGLYEGGVRISTDGSNILFVAFANENLDFYYNDNLFVKSSDGTGELRCLTKDFPYEVTRAEWSEDGSFIYFIANKGLESQLYQYDLSTAEYKQLTNGQHVLTAWDYHPATGRHIVGINKAGSPGELYNVEKGILRQITHHYASLSKEFDLPKQEKITWKGADGVEVEGLLHYPLNYEEGNRYPLVVQTHGGPASSDKYGFNRSISKYHAVLAGLGYAVLQPNYRGSTGYGDAFLRDMVGGYFRQSHLDVMAGIDALIERGIADPDKLIKMGWSAGGHMTNKLITFTDRFKAASSGAGAINWISMYGQSDVRTYRTPWFGGTPWQENAPIEVYWENSPLREIYKVKTPTLILVGQNDPRVPPPQSIELYRALRNLGVDTHLYIAPREPHGWRELKHRLYKINLELDWFAKHALNTEYTWEKAPE